MAKCCKRRYRQEYRCYTERNINSCAFIHEDLQRFVFKFCLSHCWLWRRWRWRHAQWRRQHTQQRHQHCNYHGPHAK